VHVAYDRGSVLLRQGGCPSDSTALAIFAAAVAAAFAAKWNHSIVNNVMQQKGSFSMPGKRK